MNDIYESYSSIVVGNDISHPNEISRTIYQLNKALLPILQAENKRLSESRILEIGAGWGKNLLALRSMGASKLEGVDISEEQVNQGKDLGLENLHLIRPEEDLHQQLKGEDYDIILLIDVLEHLTLPQLESLSRSIKKLLRPEGLLVLEVPNDLAPLNPIKSGDITHLRSFTTASIIQFFRLCELVPLSIRGLEFPGSGIKYTIRKFIINYILRPMITLFIRIMYGRMDPIGIIEPNIFAIGKYRSKIDAPFD